MLFDGSLRDTNFCKNLHIELEQCDVDQTTEVTTIALLLRTGRLIKWVNSPQVIAKSEEKTLLALVYCRAMGLVPI